MKYVWIFLILGPATCTPPKTNNVPVEQATVPISDNPSWHAWDSAFSMADLPWIKPQPFTSVYDSLFFEHPGFIADGFDFPVGAPHGKGYYVAQGFGVNHHLGEDWNAVTGGNTDLGDTITAIAHGYILYAGDPGGRWGKTVRMLHQLEDGTLLESVYAHCDVLTVQTGQWVARGEALGTVGTAYGRFLAHLHFELRDSVDQKMRSGYSRNRLGYRSPSKFIKANRPRVFQ